MSNLNCLFECLCNPVTHQAILLDIPDFFLRVVAKVEAGVSMLMKLIDDFSLRNLRISAMLSISHCVTKSLAVNLAYYSKTFVDCK